MTAPALRLSNCCRAMPKLRTPDRCSKCQKRAEFSFVLKPEPEGDTP